MQKLWQKKQKLNYSKNVIDIVQFGSSVLKESNPNDIDIAVIFNKISMKEQIREAHEIKKQIVKLTNFTVQIESFNLESFFQKGNFAREGILFYGRSLLEDKYFAEKFGLIPKLRVSYILKDLEKKDKVRFNYLLSGKKGNYGLLKKYGGNLISPGVIEISPENEKLFIEEMKKITDKVKVKKIFISNK